MPPGIDIPTLGVRDIALPAGLAGLTELAYNLWWSWTPRARLLFSRIDPISWSRHRNPIPVLVGTSADRWAELRTDEDFMAEAAEVLDEFHAYMNAEASPVTRRAPVEPIAYFCAEYGLQESLQLYSGGLGVLAGDHLKSASDAGLPFVAVGMLYRRGYFAQQIDADGNQEHAHPDLDPHLLPVRRARARGGGALTVEIELPGRSVHAALWVAQVGRVPLLLLDTDIATNDPEDRPIGHILYVRGREMRLCQELVLGIGGVRALSALDIRPAVWHLNEGHSAFLLLERAREVVASGEDAERALVQVGRSCVFTIHTPIPAGNEVFGRDLVVKFLGPWCEGTGLPVERLLELGRGISDAPDAGFDMTAFVLRHAADANAVSQLHGETASGTWEPVIGRPIGAITNGVHVGTWIARPMQRLFERAIGRPVASDLHSPEIAERVAGISDADLWTSHQTQKREMIAFVEDRLVRQFARHGESPDDLRELRGALDLETLTIGFARRFATYKRAALLFTDLDRLSALLRHAERPLQIIVAGKAHPADRPGQQVIEQIFALSRSSHLRGSVFLVEDYDLQIARYLVAGVDVWLNTPRRPLEASGTSGMKAAMNGVPSLSVLDGWWDEGFDGQNGWAIGGRERSLDDATQDAGDAEDLYRLLEHEIIPRYYQRGEDRLPEAWIGTMRAAIDGAIWRFSTARMLGQYVDELYLPAARAAQPEAVAS